MQKSFIVLLGIAVVFLAGLVGILIQDPAITTAQIDGDRASVAEQLSSAQSEAEKYQGGAIKAVDLHP